MGQGLSIDFAVLNGENSDDFDYIHYLIDSKDVYFITNQTTDRKTVTCEFRTSGYQPELWDALSGDIRKAEAFTQNGGLTQVPLTLEPYGAVFVVFNEEIDASQQGVEKRNYIDYESVQSIAGEWLVNFDTEWGGPESVIFPQLLDWSKHPNEGIMYYSGSAIYHKSFEFDFELDKSQSYFLQLGSVKDVGIAEVKINGRDLGVLWTSPFRVDVSDVMQKGKNELEIKIINSWYNRIAGDEILGLEQRYTSTNIVVAHDFRGREIEHLELEPSGLLGPVEILKEK